MSSQARRTSPRKRGPEAAPASRTAGSSKARRKYTRKEPTSQASTVQSPSNPTQLAASSPSGSHPLDERRVPHVSPQLPQLSSSSNEPDHQRGVVVQQLDHQDHPTPPGPQQAPFPTHHDPHNTGVAHHAGHIGAQYHSGHYQPPIPPQSHGGWHGYHYGYAQLYGPPHPEYALPNGISSHYNQASPQRITPSTQLGVGTMTPNNTPQAQLPSRLPDAQFGVDPARLVAPPPFLQTRSSNHTPTLAGPLPVPPTGDTPFQQTSALGRQVVHPITGSSPSSPVLPAQQPPSGQAFQPFIQTTIPTAATGEHLVVQQPASVQNQVTTTPTGQQMPPAFASQADDRSSDDGTDDRAPDDDNEGGNGAAIHRTPGASTGRFQGTGNTAQSLLKSKWDAEARAKGYNPDKPPSGVNPWAGYVEGVGVGHEEDPHAFYRKNYLYPPFSDQSKNTRTYNRWMGDLMTKLEDISRRTGCLLYIIAHHPNSGKPYTWYASPKLRRKAPDALTQFHGLAAKAIVDINNAEADTKMGLVGKLNQAKAQHEAALNDLDEAQATIQDLRERLRRQEEQQTQAAVTQQSTITLGRLQDL